MSVPVSKRGHGELEVNTQARKLTIHTFQILANEKYFPREQSAYIAKIQDCCLELQSLCWEANNIRVGGDPERYALRIRLQELAIGQCNRMMMLIETAGPLFHLELRRVQYWENMVKELRTLIRAWNSRDAQRLRPKLAPNTTIDMGCRLCSERPAAFGQSWQRQQHMECEHIWQREQQQRDERESASA